MHTPFDNPVPELRSERIIAYVRDLVWGYEHDFWNAKLELYRFHDEFSDYSVRYTPIVLPGKSSKGTSNLLTARIDESYLSGYPQAQKFLHKWYLNGNLPPSPDDLQFWGYVKKRLDPDSDILTQKAFDLLNEPDKSPNIFISYRHTPSSTWALAIEARLRLAGVHDVFVDKAIRAGDYWEQVLKQKVLEADHFILLVDEKLMESEWVMKEFLLAKEEKKSIIPMLHPNVDAPTILSDIQFIKVADRASSKTYEDAINELLSRLGYSTY